MTPAAKHTSFDLADVVLGFGQQDVRTTSFLPNRPWDIVRAGAGEFDRSSDYRTGRFEQHDGESRLAFYTRVADDLGIPDIDQPPLFEPVWPEFKESVALSSVQLLPLALRRLERIYLAARWVRRRDLKEIVSAVDTVLAMEISEDPTEISRLRKEFDRESERVLLKVSFRLGLAQYVSRPQRHELFWLSSN